MHRKLLSTGLALALCAGFAASAFAQVKPEILVKQRQAKMILQGKYFGPLAAMAQGKIPYNAEVVARNTRYLAALDEMAWDGFDPSTKGVKSASLPAVYAEPEKFKKAQQQFEGAIAQLVAAAKGGDEAKTKAAIGDAGKACGGCHEHFREKN
ncbi:MAG: cytochrome c [Burkholderiales bacterium]|nr:cytochrome c [Burkholderiales bacterium]